MKYVQLSMTLEEAVEIVLKGDFYDHCPTCNDSGLVYDRASDRAMYFVNCQDCHGESLLTNAAVIAHQMLGLDVPPIRLNRTGNVVIPDSVKHLAVTRMQIVEGVDLGKSYAIHESKLPDWCRR